MRRKSKPDLAQGHLFAVNPVNNGLVCGVDEAGRGPLAGPVVAAAVILDPAHPISGLDDSKKLSARMREHLAEEIRQHALAWHIASASVAEIDQINILQATLLAMQRAVQGLVKSMPDLELALVQVDGNKAPRLAYPVQTIIGGDALVAEISAASILAKTARDAQMLELHLQYTEYGFNRHMGYGTALHLENLRIHGAIAEHRQSFAPVRAVRLRDIAA